MKLLVFFCFLVSITLGYGLPSNKIKYLSVRQLSETEMNRLLRFIDEKKLLADSIIYVSSKSSKKSNIFILSKTDTVAGEKFYKNSLITLKNGNFKLTYTKKQFYFSIFLQKNKHHIYYDESIGYKESDSIVKAVLLNKRFIRYALKATGITIKKVGEFYEIQFSEDSDYQTFMVKISGKNISVLKENFKIF